MGLLSWMTVGLVAGWLASLVMQGGRYGILGDIILGIIGALVGGFIAGITFNVPDSISGVNPTTLFIAFVGAIVLVAIARALSGPQIV